MMHRSIEVYYNIADIPGATGPLDALPFRNAAMEHIENALMQAGLGEWAGAEVGGDEVNFGFDVEDFDKAEAVIRSSVKGTPYDGIRELQRREFEFDETAQAFANEGGLAFPEFAQTEISEEILEKIAQSPNIRNLLKDPEMQEAFNDVMENSIAMRYLTGTQGDEG